VEQVWNLESNLVIPDDGKLSFYYNMVSNVRAKSNAGFPTQIVSGFWRIRDTPRNRQTWYRAMGIVDPHRLITGRWLLEITFSLLNTTCPVTRITPWLSSPVPFLDLQTEAFRCQLSLRLSKSTRKRLPHTAAVLNSRREPDEIVIPGNASVYEMTPYEFGSWAFGSTRKVRGAFTPIEYLGSELNNGQLNGSCYKGFDQLS
jgi:lysophospholipase